MSSVEAEPATLTRTLSAPALSEAGDVDHSEGPATATQGEAPATRSTEAHAASAMPMEGPIDKKKKRGLFRRPSWLKKNGNKKRNSSGTDSAPADGTVTVQAIVTEKAKPNWRDRTGEGFKSAGRGALIVLAGIGGIIAVIVVVPVALAGAVLLGAVATVGSIVCCPCIACGAVFMAASN